MAIVFTEGSAEEAQKWIEASALSEEEKGQLLRFVQRFPEITFYKQSLGGTPPLWLQLQAGVLNGFLKGQLVWVQFDAFDYPAPHVSLKDTWYRLTLQGEVDAAHPKVYLEDKQAYFVGVEMEHYKTMLAVLFDEEDKKVYEFDYTAVRPNSQDFEDDEEDADYPQDGFGHIEPERIQAVFDSRCSMFGHICAIRLKGGTEFQAAI